MSYQEQDYGPRRRRTPVWVWILGGCGGCVLLVVGGCGLLGFGAYKWASDTANVGPINQTTVQQSLGADVPIYPGSTVEPQATRTMLIPIRLVERTAGQGPGSMFPGAGIFHTQDKPETVLAYYKKQLKALKWQPAQTGAGPTPTSNSNVEQLTYGKGKDFLTVQVSPANPPEKKTMIFLMRFRKGVTPPATPTPGSGTPGSSGGG